MELTHEFDHVLVGVKKHQEENWEEIIPQCWSLTAGRSQGK